MQWSFCGLLLSVWQSMPFWSEPFTHTKGLLESRYLMCQKEIYPSEELICIGIKELGDERRAIFLRWLESHSGVKELKPDGQVQERLNTWLYSLPLGEAIAEHSLIVAEIT
jgi:hypothetical protein